MGLITEFGELAGISGIAFGILLYLLKDILRKSIFSKLTNKQSFRVLISIIITVWSLSLTSLILSKQNNSSSQLTVLVHGEKGKDYLVLPSRGKVKLIFGDANVVETINDKGEATFKQIPEKFFNSEATVEILFFDPEGEPYRSIYSDSLYILTKGRYISLTVRLLGLDQLNGVVKDYETGEFIQNVHIRVSGIESISNEYGEYTLEIPDEKQRKFHIVRAFKEGYKDYEFKNAPIQTEKEFPILMKRRK